MMGRSEDSPQRTNAWRLSALDDAEIACPLLKHASGDKVVVAVVERVRAALENHYNPQLHNSMHPADLITKVFELPGHENLTKPRTWEDYS